MRSEIERWYIWRHTLSLHIPTCDKVCGRPIITTFYTTRAKLMRHRIKPNARSIWQCLIVESVIHVLHNGLRFHARRSIWSRRMMMLELLAIIVQKCIWTNEFDNQQRMIVHASLTSLQVQVHGMPSNSFETRILADSKLTANYAIRRDQLWTVMSEPKR